MSLDAMIWAVKDAPVVDVAERAVLGTMSEEADEDGEGAGIGVTTIAERCRLSTREVRRCLSDMVERRLLERGDQSRVAYLRADKRPVVYNLMIPASAFGKAGLERINKFRQRHGRPPITEENRPDLKPAPPKKQRADAGKPRKKKDDGGTTSPPVNGVTTSPGGLQVQNGGTTSPQRGDYKSADPEVLDPELLTHPPHPHADRVAAEPGTDEERGGGGSNPKIENGPGAPTLDDLAVAVAERFPGRRFWDTATVRSVLAEAVAEKLASAQDAAAALVDLGEGRYDAQIGSKTKSPRRLTTFPDPPWFADRGAAASAAERDDGQRCAKPGHREQPAGRCGLCASEAIVRPDDPQPTTEEEAVKALWAAGLKSRRLGTRVVRPVRNRADA